MAVLSQNGGLAVVNNTARADSRFPDPFCDLASLAFPKTIDEALTWCEYVLTKNGLYTQALERILAYFITDIEITAADTSTLLAREESKRYEEYLYDVIDIRRALREVGLDYLGYGNSFSSILLPFSRYLSCPAPGCGYERTLRAMHADKSYNLRWSNFGFTATCPRCKFQGEWTRIDRRVLGKDEIVIKRWSPHEMEINHDRGSNANQYLWRIPADYASQLEKSDVPPFVLERARWEVVEAVKMKGNLLFAPGELCHLAMPPLAGHNMKGWGLSRVLINFGQAWLYQILHRQVEAVSADFATPHRIITPMARGGNGDIGDPMLNLNMGDVTAVLRREIAAHRVDPLHTSVLPFPVDYRAHGGDASQYAPKDLLELAKITLLNSIGAPIEFFEARLTAQSGTTMLRVLEANWSHLVHALNTWLKFAVQKISQYKGWKPVKVKMARVRYADDLNRQMAMMQLMMAGKISATTGLATLGLSQEEESHRSLDEQRHSAELAARQQAEMDTAAASQQLMPPPAAAFADPAMANGQPPAGPSGPPGMPGPAMPGSPNGPGGLPAGPAGAAAMFGSQQVPLPGQSVSLEDLQSQAVMIAEQLMSSPEGVKDSQLIALKKQNEVLHLMVKSHMDKIRRDAELRGRELVLQQQAGAV